MFFDSHAHLTVDGPFQDLEGILERAQERSVGQICNINIDALSLERGLAMKQDHIAQAGATTPHDVEKLGEVEFPLFEKAALSGQLNAVGETGLDYFYEHSNRALQQEFLVRYFDLAKRANLPIIFHCRDAFYDLFALADKHFDGPAILHCFTGTMDEAKKGLDRGWLISFSGILTFKKSNDLREVAKEIPLSSCLIETDTPYLAPQTKRGKPNEPSFLPETAAMLAQIKDLPIEEIASTTTQTSRQFFQM